ncbi:MAG: vanadium-dependent haloperoxidase [Pseudomonadota bacterium]
MNLQRRTTARSVAAVAATLLYLVFGTPGARADVVMDWNATAARLPIAAPPVLARVMATMHGAIHDAINSVEPRYETYRFKVQSPPNASKDAAAASAAHGVLTALVPGQRAVFDAALAASLAKIPEERAKADGLEVGKSVAEQMLAWRAKDRFDAKAEDKPGATAGLWQRTPPGMLPGVLPHLGDVTPFVLKSAEQFSIKGRPALTSSEFIRDLKESKSLGGRHSTARTAEQTAAAIFWADNEIPPLNAAARAASTAKKLSPHENARLFALMHMASADTTIVAFKIKYGSNAWRPITAIRAGYGPVAPDPTWESLLITPPHPEYPSGHCIVTGASMQVLREFFGSDQVKLDYVYPPGLGITRSYTSYTQIEKEMEDARVWAGIHFRSTDEHSTELGRKVASYAMANILRPLGAVSGAPAPATQAASNP